MRLQDSAQMHPLQEAYQDPRVAGRRLPRCAPPCLSPLVADSRQICHCFPACLPILITDWAASPCLEGVWAIVNAYTGDRVGSTAVRSKQCLSAFSRGVLGEKAGLGSEHTVRAPRWCTEGMVPTPFTTARPLNLDTGLGRSISWLTSLQDVH